MQELNIIEVEYLKKIVNFQDINYQKLLNYSDYSVDPQIKQTFKKAAQDALNAKEKLLNFLS